MTRRARITVAAADALEPGGYLWDDRVPGLGLRGLTRSRAWVFRYKGPRGRERQITLGRYPEIGIKDARALAQRRAGEVAYHRDPLAELRSGTVADLLDHYARHHRTRVKGRRPTECRDTRRRLAVLREQWGAMRVGEVRYTHVAELLDAIEGKYAANRMRALIRGIWNRGRVWGLVPATVPNPVEGTVANPERPKVSRAPTPAELRRIIVAAWAYGRPSGVLIGLVCLTGARPSELMGLRWADVDFERRTILLRDRKAGDTLRFPLSEVAYHELVMLGQRGASGPWVFPSGSKSGHIEDVRKAWTAVRRAAGLGSDVQLYDVRAAVATLIDRALGLKAAQRMLGHADARTTMRYVRAGDEQAREGVDAIAAGIFTPPTAPTETS